MSNLSGRIAVYTTPEKKAEVEAAIAESGSTQQEWLRDALERALAPDAATGDDREMELSVKGGDITCHRGVAVQHKCQGEWPA